MRLKIFIGLLLGGVTLAIYWPARHFDIIYLNDGSFMTVPEVSSGLNRHSLEWVMTGVVAANWHPATNLSFLLTHQFFGYNPGAEHLVNVLFHAANVMLLFLVLARMTNRNSPTTPSPHPDPLPSHRMGAEREQQPDATGHGTSNSGHRPVFVRMEKRQSRLTPAATRSWNVWPCAIVAGIFAWHPLRVESVAWIAERKDVMFVFFMLLSLLCYASYVRPKKGTATTGSLRLWNVSYILALLFFALSFMSKAMAVTLPFLLLLLDLWPLRRFEGVFGGLGTPQSRGRLIHPALKRLLVEKIPFFALAIIFCAFTLWIHKMHGNVASLGTYGMGERVENTVLSYVNYLGKLIWPTQLAMPYPYPKYFDGTEVLLAGLLLLAISALCVLQIPRRPYLATGWFWYLGAMVPAIGLVQTGYGQGMADRYTYVPLIGVTISLVWLVWEWAGTHFFRKWLAGSMAVVILAVCVVLTPRQLQYWQNDVSLFERTIAVTPGNSLAQSSLATGLEQKGLLREAAVHYRIAMALTPTDFHIPYELAKCLEKEGYRRGALEEYEAVIADGYDPYDVVANLEFADALAHLGRYQEAESFLDASLRLNPDSAIALNYYAWMLATCPDANIRDGAHAVQLGERACELTNYKQTQIIGTLAAAYAEAGRFDDAVATAQKAIASAQRQGETELAARNQELLKFYLAHKAYHEANNK